MGRKPREKSESMIYDSTRICPVCQKEFVVYDESWAFTGHLDTNKHRKVWFCSWGCMRKYERGETNLTGRGVRLSEKKRKIWAALDDGLTVHEISTLLDVPVTQVNYYKYKRPLPKDGE